MIVAVPRETAAGERRVALVPEVVAAFTRDGHTVRVQRGAGSLAFFSDTQYERAGATLADDERTLLDGAEVLACVGRPSEALLSAIAPKTLVVGLLNPLADPEYARTLAARGVTAVAMELIPRITRAQPMDALSSQSNIAGYKAVLLAAERLPKFFPMLTTAAGTVPPAKVFVIGAGVAGLQAIATARRLGAVVSAYDARAVVAEQVRSLGAQFAEFDLGTDAEGAGGYARELSPEQIAAQQRFLAERAAENDVVITTAQVPGKRAPLLITDEAVHGMQPGSVIVDLAAETGGNCARTRRDEVVTTENGVTIIGTTNLAATLPVHASKLYARNVQALLQSLMHEGRLRLDREHDEIFRAACIVFEGTVTS
jgi:NAD(P) transhydrogenase subunit alpha